MDKINRIKIKKIMFGGIGIIFWMSCLQLGSSSNAQDSASQANESPGGQSSDLVTDYPEEIKPGGKVESGPRPVETAAVSPADCGPCRKYHNSLPIDKKPGHDESLVGRLVSGPIKGGPGGKNPPPATK